MIEPIRLDDRISTVLARDERLLEVLVAAAPAFKKLQNPLLRKTMSKLATVEQAARIAGLDAADLLARLNGALAGEPPRDVRPIGAARAAPPQEAVPAALLDVPPERIVDLDVREELRAGREPFRLIMSAAGRVDGGGVLRLRAIFEPAPLYPVLGRQGFSHFTEQLGADDWRVWFWRDGGGAHAARGATTPAVAPIVEEPDVIVLDVRGLEPPEPMVQTLEALERLPRGKTLLQINVRVPQFLLPQLAARGFVHEVRVQSEDLVRIFIRHAHPGEDLQGDP
jgi:uncharacterized protein (DUF2249 family)